MNIKIEAPTEEELEARVEEVDLGGVILEFTIPKSNRLIQGYRRASLLPKDEQGLASIDTQYAWLEQGFGRETWDYLQERLEDPEDWLDHPHMTEMFKQLMTKVTGRPTTSRRSSSGPPRRSKQTEKLSKKGSDSED